MIKIWLFSLMWLLKFYLWADISLRMLNESLIITIKAFQVTFTENTYLVILIKFQTNMTFEEDIYERIIKEDIRFMFSKRTENLILELLLKFKLHFESLIQDSEIENQQLWLQTKKEWSILENLREFLKSIFKLKHLQK